MDSHFIPQDLCKILDIYKGCILYTPLHNEPDYSDSLFPLKIPSDKVILPIDKNTDPFEWADICIQHFKDTVPYILIPGIQFDRYGTRHGKGGGWYDRFLSKLPKPWIRIGITDITKLSSEKLLKKPWDQPMDWLLVLNEATLSWEIYQTFAR